MPMADTEVVDLVRVAAVVIGLVGNMGLEAVVMVEVNIVRMEVMVVWVLKEEILPLDTQVATEEAITEVIIWLLIMVDLAIVTQGMVVAVVQVQLVATGAGDMTLALEVVMEVAAVIEVAVEVHILEVEEDMLGQEAEQISSLWEIEFHETENGFSGVGSWVQWPSWVVALSSYILMG